MNGKKKKMYRREALLSGLEAMSERRKRSSIIWLRSILTAIFQKQIISLKRTSFSCKKSLSLTKWTPLDRRERIGSNLCGNGFWKKKKPRNWCQATTFLKFATISKKLERTYNCETNPSPSHFARPPNSHLLARQIRISPTPFSLPRASARGDFSTQLLNLDPARTEEGRG